MLSYNTNVQQMEMFSYPCTKIIKVEAGDVDNLAYFTENIGMTKEIRYYEKGMIFMYKDVFEYNPDLKTEIFMVKRVKDLYLGLFDASGAVLPVLAEDEYVYIGTAGTIGIKTYAVDDVIANVGGVIGKASFDLMKRKWKLV